MINYSFTCFAMIFASIFNFFGGSEEPYKKYEARMNKTINSSIKQLKTRYGLISIGSGGRNIDNKSQMESISFHLYHKITKEDARILLVEVVELILHNINNNKEITPYLHDNPFTFKNLEIALFIFDESRSDIHHPNLGLISLNPWGTISFVTYANEGLCKRASDVEEPYEQAYKIVTQKDTLPPINL